ncbi:MAG: hypothetical protein ABI840_02470 [bacterium]
MNYKIQNIKKIAGSKDLKLKEEQICEFRKNKYSTLIKDEQKSWKEVELSNNPKQESLETEKCQGL